MFKHKKQSKLEDDHFTALDAAVSELSKQTDALLSGFGTESNRATTTNEKPTFTKKKNVLHTKGKSFDIIHDPKRRAHLKATLKSAAPVTRLIPVETELLLPGQASKSYNELSEPSEKNVVVPVETSKIQLNENRLDTREPVVSGVDSEPVITSTSPSKAVSHTTLSFSEPEQSESTDNKSTTQEPKVSKDPIQPVAELSQEEVVTDSEKKIKAEEAKETEVEKLDEQNTGTLYPNNLVKDTEPKGYEAPETEGKPAIFDTETYHPELHDWSKLDHSNSKKWILLVLLLVVAGSGAYFILSGQKLPFRLF